jgi:hypothetical protein
MKYILLCTTLTLFLTSCGANKEKDLSCVLKKYYESIESNNKEELKRLSYYMNKCGNDSLILIYKKTLFSLNEIEKAGVQKIEFAKDANQVKNNYNIYLDSMKLYLLNNFSEKDAGAINIQEDNYSLPELKIITQTNLIIGEKKIRDNILGSIAIDCQ